MAMHGTIGEYDPQREDWTSYSERLLEYFTANDVDGADKKRAILLSVVGAQTYQLIRNLVAPGKPTEKSFGELVKLVKGHYQPTPSVIVQRFKFNSRAQLQGESIATFIAELRRLSEHCGYGESLNDMLRDRLVCGTTNSQLQKRLLSEPDLTFKKALELAQALESSEQGSQYLQQQQKHTPNVNKLDRRPRPPASAVAIPGKPCYRCGGPHSSAKCRFKEASCHLCKKTGHIAKMCRSSQLPSQKQTSRELPHSSKNGIAKTIQLIKWKGGEAVHLRILRTIPMNFSTYKGLVVNPIQLKYKQTRQNCKWRLTQGLLYPSLVRKPSRTNGPPKISQSSTRQKLSYKPTLRRVLRS